MSTSSSRSKSTIPAVLLGLSSLCFYVGYFVNGYIVETIIQKMHENVDRTIDKHAGYTAQSIQFAVFAIGCFLGPSIIDLIGSKKALMLCSTLFCLFYAGFLHFNLYYFYISHGFLGFGYGLFNGAEGAYISEHSTEQTVGWSLSLETTISHLGLLGAAAALFVGKYILPHFGEQTEYSQTHIKVLYGSFLLFGLISLLINCLLPNEPLMDSIASKSKKKKENFLQRCKNLLIVARNPLLWLFSPMMIYQGIFGGFFLSAYPASFGFDERLTSITGWLAVTSLFFAGIGIFVGGAIVSAGSRWFHNFALTPSMVLHYVAIGISLVLIYLSCPNEVFFQRTNKDTTIVPGHVLVGTIAVLVGICDCTITTTRGYVCQRMLPKSRDEMYSATRLIQAFSSAAVLALSRQLTTQMWLFLFIGSGTISIIAYVLCIYFWNRSSKITDADAIKLPESKKATTGSSTTAQL